MRLDLACLRQMHPLLPEAIADARAYCAAVGLERNGHVTGVPMVASIDDAGHHTTLAWSDLHDGVGLQLDRHRVTEDGAEAITLAFVSVGLGWVVRRRGQRGDFYDWLLHDQDGNKVALEVSGTDAGDIARRLREKVLQVRRARADQRVACVVELASPQAELATAG